MPDYDFLNLSPPEFEDLTKDILQKKLKITFESFTNGRDGGIDLRYSQSRRNKIIVQCKRYKDYSNLISNLKKEKAKVIKLNPSRYIISTTVSLTPDRKDEILNIFEPYLKQTSDILGKDDLNSALASYPKIELEHFKLWLSSANILDRILHSKIHNQTSFEEENIKETINLYVDNESYYEANKIIKEKKYVIISGIPGIGKTTLARILVYHYLANGFEEFIFLSDSINDAYTKYKDGVNQIFLFDDFLGTNFLENKLSNNEEQRIVKFIEKVSKSKDKIIILTTREYILAQAKLKYDAFDSPNLEFAKCIIDLSQYTQIVKAKILYNHIYFSNLSEKHISNLLKNEVYREIINHPNYNPRIIQTITNDAVWKTIEPSNFASQFLEFISNPTSVWRHVYENQISALSQLVLVNLMALSSPILLEDLKLVVQNFAKHHSSKYGIIFSELEFKKSIKELENTFIKISKDSNNLLKIDYQNPSVQDFLVFYFKDNTDFITDILKATTYFNQIFAIFSFKDNLNFRISNRILLNNEQIEIAINKLITEFDYLNSTILRRYSSSFDKDTFSGYTKLNEIIRHIDIDDFPHLKEFIINRFSMLLYPSEFQLDNVEIRSYIDLLDEFKDDLEIDRSKVLEHISESIIDISDFEEFERFESIFDEDYFTIITHDERHKQRIFTLLEIEAENADDDSLDSALEEILERAKKYRIRGSKFEDIINFKKMLNSDEDEDRYDWNSEKRNRSKHTIDVDNIIIKNLFDSLKVEDKGGS